MDKNELNKLINLLQNNYKITEMDNSILIKGKLKSAVIPISNIVSYKVENNKIVIELINKENIIL